MKKRLIFMIVSISLISLLLLSSVIAKPAKKDFVQLSSSGVYTTDVYIDGSNTQYRLFFNGFHFLTIIKTGEGAFIIRPHSGVDADGWGSSLYLQPFLAGAEQKNSVVDSITAYSDRIEVKSHGLVSRWTSSSYGTWNSSLTFTYNPTEKKVDGNGTYNILLSGSLSDSTGDLNLYKLASNYLNNVPLVSGCTGDTGDTDYTSVTSSNPILNFVWHPELQPGHFPWDFADWLSVDASGQYNNIDTSAYGYQIAKAYKPSLKVVLNSKQSGIRMIFGGIYDTSKAQDFTQDNVGITPLIVRPTSKLNYNFDVSFSSFALPGDGTDINRDGLVDTQDFTLLKLNFGQACSSPLWCGYSDINRDGLVDTQDFTLLKLNFGNSVGQCN